MLLPPFQIIRHSNNHKELKFFYVWPNLYNRIIIFILYKLSTIRFFISYIFIVHQFDIINFYISLYNFGQTWYCFDSPRFLGCLIIWNIWNGWSTLYSYAKTLHCCKLMKFRYTKSCWRWKFNGLLVLWGSCHSWSCQLLQGQRPYRKNTQAALCWCMCEWPIWPRC